MAERHGRAAYAWFDRRMVVLALVVPAVFIVALEVVRHLLEGRDPAHLLTPQRLAFLVLLVLGVSAYGLVMLSVIARAQRHVIRQNHQLAATNAVTQAVQGNLSAEAIADLALTHVLAASGAQEATITLAPGPETGGQELVRTLRAGTTGRADPLAAPEEEQVVEVALRGSDGDVGWLRLLVDPGLPPQDALALGTLRSIGHQVAMAVELSHHVADLHRRKDEGHAFYDVLLQIGEQISPLLVLSSISQYARDLLAADAAVITVTDDVAATLALTGRVGGPLRSWVSSGVVSSIDPPSDPTDRAAIDALMAEERWGSSVSVPVNGPVCELGRLWVGQAADQPLSGRGHGFLMTLAELAAVAISSAQERELSQARSVVDERERIAREMHDSLAQVLGATHLRLRALQERPGLDGPVRAEVTALADVCADAYKDVREGILGLRGEHAGRREFEDSLRTYVRRWSEQCGVEAAFENRFGVPFALTPRSEVQLLRVVQEALTNVRKHAAASSARVEVSAGRTSDGLPATLLTIADDGRGFHGGGSPEPGSGFGLVAMHDRLGLLGGTLTVDSAPGRGTRVVATVPEVPRPSPTGR